MKTIFTLLLAFNLSLIQAQSKKKQDLTSIMNMCGCYEITFNFAETFASDPDYEFHDNYKSGALELVVPVLEEKNKVVLQHLLVISDSMIIKHWRQDWLYENQDLYAYDKSHTWNYTLLPKNQVKGQWTQKVYQVDDSPRYEGSGSWVHTDGKHYWESKADAPLPRREYSKRSDYDVTVRRNRQALTDYGWVHEQDNDKVVRSATGDQVLASEKGMNTYKKVETSKCKAAQNWWASNSAYWEVVRSVWDEVFEEKSTLSLNMKVENKKLFQRLFSLGDEYQAKDFDSNDVKQKIRSIIKLHQKESSTITAMSY